MPTFETTQEAIAAGYTPIGPYLRKPIETYGAIKIKVADITERPYIGYRYAVGYFVGHDFKIRAKSVSVHLSQERNKLGQLGCYTEMFPPGEFDQAVGRCRAEIPKARAENIKCFLLEYAETYPVAEIEKEAGVSNNLLVPFLKGQIELDERELNRIESVLMSKGLADYYVLS